MWIIGKKRQRKKVFLNDQPTTVLVPPVECENLPPLALLLVAARHAVPDAVEGAAHDLAEIALVLRVERHDADLVRANVRLRGLDHRLVRLLLQLVHDEEQQEGALEQVDAEKVGHKGQVRVDAQNVRRRLRRRHGVRRGRDEFL